jgi:hypothetical protein
VETRLTGQLIIIQSIELSTTKSKTPESARYRLINNRDLERRLRYYLEFLTAVINKNAVSGIDAAKILPVTAIPNSGAPELSSNTEPTAAIAEIEAPSRHIPVKGVYMNGYFDPELICWTCWSEKPFFLSSSVNASSFSTRSTNNTPVR